MTYSINGSGHCDTPEEEKKALEAAKAFKAAAPGLTSLSFSSTAGGSVNLMQAETPAAAPTDTGSSPSATSSDAATRSKTERRPPA